MHFKSFLCLSLCACAFCNRLAAHQNNENKIPLSPRSLQSIEESQEFIQKALERATPEISHEELVKSIKQYQEMHNQNKSDEAEQSGDKNKKS